MLLPVLLAGQQRASVPDLAAAHSAEQAGNFAAAETIYARMVSENPNAELYQRLGLVRHLQNKFEPAAKAFEAAIRLDPSLWTSHLFLGIDLYRLNRFDDAAAHLAKADRLHPGDREVKFWMGANELARHHYIAGFEALEFVLERDPTNAEVLRMLAESYASYGTALLDEVGNKYPNSPAGLIVQGKAFEFEGAYGPALDSYRAALALTPNRPGLRESINRVKAEMRDSHSAAH